jgi:hypothetical protein
MIKLKNIMKNTAHNPFTGELWEGLIYSLNIDKALNIPSISNNQINPQLVALSTNQIQKQLQRQINILNQPTKFQTPNFKIPKIPDVFIPFIPKGSSGAGNQYLKNLKRQNKKFEGKYTSSLAAAFFQEKPIKVSRKEYERLSKVQFGGFETRPLLEISEKSFKKQLKSVNF